MAIKASLHLNKGQKLGGLTFENTNSNAFSLPEGACLQFLSVVETTKIQLHLSVGPCSPVSIEDAALESWFSNILLGPPKPFQEAWWRTAHPDSSLGVLVSVEPAGSDSRQRNAVTPQITELLFYASRDALAIEEVDAFPAAGSQKIHLAAPPATHIYALPLSSHLWHPQTAEPTPPSSPDLQAREDEAVFLPPLHVGGGEHINEPPVRKRKSAADVLNEADDRRRKARRKGGAGVAPKSEPSLPSLNHRRSMSHGQSVPLQTRTLSRSPSIASSRPPTAVAAGPQRSSLSRVESLAGHSGSDVESKNKELISRTVMAGMRLYGLVQKKSRKSFPSGQASPAVDVSFENLEKDRREEEEYKLIYHQTYRGTCIAFRSTIVAQDLQSVSEAVRDVVDRLLAVYCNDPLADGLVTKVDKLTPGGRKAFSSS